MTDDVRNIVLGVVAAGPRAAHRRPEPRSPTGLPLLRPARDPQPGGDPLPRPQPRTAGTQTRQPLLRPASEGRQLAGVRPRRRRGRHRHHPGRPDPRAGRLGTHFAPRMRPATSHMAGVETKESGTLVAYLCDVGPLGLGKLVSLVDLLCVEHNPTGAADLLLAGARPLMGVDTPARAVISGCRRANACPPATARLAAASLIRPAPRPRTAVPVPMGMNGKS